MYNEYLLNNDCYSRKLTEKDNSEIIQKAKKVAISCAKNYTIENIYEELKKDGFIFKKVENSVDSKGVFFRARILIEKNNRFIYIYEDTVEKAAKKHSKEKQFIQDLYVAHEFFHYLEYKNKISLNYKIVRKQIFGYKFYGNVRAISEIGANIFAMNVLKTQFNPMKLDIEEKYV
ncbi:MAG: hypothetical protein ACRC5R_05580 [Mycoplasmatales bacterium]